MRRALRAVLPRRSEALSLTVAGPARPSLRTPYPVSTKRLDKVWQQLQH